MKENWKPGTLIYPLPAVLVSCGATPDEYNLLTVAWTGTVCTNPPMCYISVRPERHSYDIIRRTGEFVINLTTEELARATDWCGVRSGRDHDKFRETGLTPVPATVVKAPVVAEAPLSIECRVRQILPLGSHDLFLAEVVNIQADSRYIDSETGKLELQKARPIVYSHGEYFALGRMLGYFGWSVRRKKRIKRERQPDKMKNSPCGRKISVRFLFRYSRKRLSFSDKAAAHSGSRNPTKILSEAISKGRFTNIPSVESTRISSSREAVRTFFFQVERLVTQTAGIEKSIDRKTAAIDPLFELRFGGILLHDIAHFDFDPALLQPFKGFLTSAATGIANKQGFHFHRISKYKYSENRGLNQICTNRRSKHAPRTLVNSAMQG